MYLSFGSFDVAVVGGGTAGAIAGITAARYGLKTIIIEQAGFLGGTQTGALVTPMMSLLIAGEPQISRVNQEVQQRLQQQRDGRGLWFNTEALKFVLEEMFVEAGGKLLYFTSFVDVIKEQDKIKQLRVYNKSGMQTIEAAVVIDCTGDADVAVKAGICFESGKRTTGINQPMSVRFEVGNIDLKKFGDFLKALGQTENTEPGKLYGAHTLDQKWPLTAVFRKGLHESMIREKDAKYFQFFTVPGKPGVLSFNCPEISEHIDGTNTVHLLAAYSTCIRIMWLQ